MKWKTNILDKVSNISKNRDDHKPNQGQGVKLFECEGFGHIKIEHLTFLRKL